ncbi:MAG TPA: hypothetical protein VMF61_14925 [Candidatus Acidoferrales bacterium]|nr:hypothetical protein [Candidatus Acidoferrales bacterium]
MNASQRTSAGSVAAAAFAVACAAASISGCGERAAPATPAPLAAALAPAAAPYPTALPKLYVDHNGTLAEYRLPLKAGAKPVAILKEDPGSAIAPQIAVNYLGSIAVATSAELRFFMPPIVSFEPKRATLILPFNGAITAVGDSGAELNDIEFDTVGNLWLVSNIGGEITELRKPLRKTSVASVFVLFGVKGTKTSAFTSVLQARFDVNNTLYAYAGGNNGDMLFKLAFPYGGEPSPTGLNLEQADYVDASQYLPTAPYPQSLILGQYVGPLHSPPPQQPPPPPVDVLSQFAEPLNPIHGLFPSIEVNQIVGALIADPPRLLFYTLDVNTGRLDVWPLPLGTGDEPRLSFPCFAGGANCKNKPEHLFLAP